MASPKKQPKKKPANADMAENDVLAFKSLLQHPGWQKLIQIMSDNEDLLKTQILNKKNLTGEPLTDAECDRLRDRLSGIEEIRTAPERYIALLTSKEDAIDTDYDPYERAGEKLFDNKR